MAYQITTALTKILKLTKRIRAIQGGTGASKTISILQDLIDLAQRDKDPTLTSIVSESVPHLKKGCIRDFKNIMQHHNYWREDRWQETDKIYTFESGSQIEFFGAEQADKLRGGRRDRLYINECNNVSFSAFEELEVRTKDLVYLDWNPVGDFWFYQLKEERNDIDHIILTYMDNESLPEATVASIEQRKGRPDWWQVYGLGQLGVLEGKIYTDWLIIDHVPHEARLERYGLDFGYSNDPTAIVAVYYHNGGYILDEIVYQKGLSNKNISDILKNQDTGMIIADCAEPKSIDEIRAYGLPIFPTDKGKDSKKFGIDVVRQQRISITKNSLNGIKEYRNYLWFIDKDGNKDNTRTDGADDFLDAVRYAICSIVPALRQSNTIILQQERFNKNNVHFQTDSTK
jgi:phage terminase large subunit